MLPLIKLVATPLLIAAATLTARRWGPGVGGWLAGLPLTSGPVSIFLALEQGPAFATQAARGTLLGVIAVAAFCVVYARVARGSGWVLPALAGLLAYFAATFGLSRIAPSLPIAALMTLLAVVVGLAIVGRPAPGPVSARPGAWDLPFRMIAATGIVFAITAGAQILGPHWSGLLSPFPVFALVMAAFSQRQGGAADARRVLRGVLAGSFGFASFFIVVAAALERTGLVATYALAAVLAIGVNGLTLFALVPRGSYRPAT